MDSFSTARMEKMQALADTILEKLRIRVEQTQPEEINPQTFKHMTGVMKDLKDIQLLPLDVEEQRAKIRNLQRQQEQEGSASIAVVFAPELEEYSV